MSRVSPTLDVLFDETTRPGAARALARFIGCERLSIYIPDSHGGLHALSHMPWLADADSPTDHADDVVLRADNGTTLVAAGGHPRRARIEALAHPLGLLGCALEARQTETVLRARINALEAETRRLSREAQAASRTRDEFLATLSHEMRTPLNALLGWVQLLRRHVADPVIRDQALDVVERSARAQVQIVADLLDLSRVITGEMHLAVESIVVGDLVRRSVQTLLPMALARNVRLDYAPKPSDRDEAASPSPSPSPFPAALTVRGDPARLQQVIWNLVNNALKFTPAGGRVAVGVRDEAAGVVIEVSDTGIGIAPDTLPFIFDPFRQGESGISRAYGGLGLGLAIVRHLVELHGGRVAAESAGLTQGATFTITLPVPPVSVDEGQTAVHASESGRT